MNKNEDFIEIWIPSLKRFESFNPINNFQFKAIAKHFATKDIDSVQWKTGFLKCLWKIIENNHVEFYENSLKRLSFVDVAIILMNLKSASIDGRLKFDSTCEETDQKFSTTIVLDDLEQKILKLPIFETEKIGSLSVGLPRFSFEKVDFQDFSQIIHSCIDDEISLEYVGKISAKISSQIFKRFKSFEKISQELDLFLLQSPFSGKVQFCQKFSLIPDFFVVFYKLLFEENLLSVYQMYWHSLKELQIDSNFLNEITPIELRSVFFKFYKTEKERENKSQESENPLKGMMR